MGDGATQLLIDPSKTKEVLREYDTSNPVCKYVIGIVFFILCFLTTLVSIMYYVFSRIMDDVMEQ